jgi:hypothetical protein
MAAQRALAEAMHTSPPVMAQRKLGASMSAATAQRQAQGRVQTTMQLKIGAPGNDDAGVEREVDVLGEQALKSAHENGEKKSILVQRARSNTIARIPALNTRPISDLVVQRQLTFSAPAGNNEGEALLNAAYAVGLPDGQNALLAFNVTGQDAWGRNIYTVTEANKPDIDGIGSHLIGKLIEEGNTNIYFGEDGANDARPTNAEEASAGRSSGGTVLLTEGATAIQLIHELIHTYHFNFDPWDARQKEQQVANGSGQGNVSAEEASTVGLGQWQDFALTENAFRAELNLPLRTEY